MSLTVDQIISTVAGIITAGAATYAGKNTAQIFDIMHDTPLDPDYHAPPVPQVGVPLAPADLVNALSPGAAAYLADHLDMYYQLLDVNSPAGRLPAVDLLVKGEKFTPADKLNLAPLLATHDDPSYTPPPPNRLPSIANLLFATGGAFFGEQIPAVKPPETGGTTTGQVPAWVIREALILLNRPT